MIHAFCAALVLLGLVIVDWRAHRRAVALLGAIGSLRSAAQLEGDEGDEGEDEGGIIMDVEFDGPTPGDPPVKVPVHLDAATTERIDVTVAAVREEGDRPSGSWPAYRPSPPPDDGDHDA